MAKKIHGRATTTPATRKAIQENTTDSIAVLARRYGVTYKTAKKWKDRNTTEDQKCGPESKSKSLTPQQEAAVIVFRIFTLLPLDDCLYALQDKIPHLTRSTLYRCFQRYGITRLAQKEKEKKIKQPKKFKAYPPGYIHVDIAQAHTKEGKIYLFVAIDRTTKFCFVRLYKDQTAATAVKFLNEMKSAFPNIVQKILTDNGLQFTRHRGDKASHIFTQTCKKLGIEHRTTKIYSPQTNGQVERMNRTLKEATTKKYFYANHEALQRHLDAFIATYNYAKKLKALKGLTPYEKICLYLRSKEGVSCLNTRYKFPEPYTFLHN